MGEAAGDIELSILGGNYSGQNYEAGTPKLHASKTYLVFAIGNGYSFSPLAADKAIFELIDGRFKLSTGAMITPDDKTHTTEDLLRSIRNK